MNITLIFLLMVNLCLAHPGGLIKSGPNKGCHNDRKNKTFHCHRAGAQPLKLVGNVRKSKSMIVQASKYVRDDWGYPTDLDSDCQNTRAELLISRSSTPVTFKNKKKCVVLTGEWEDFYHPGKETLASKVEIDHVVPLKNAFDHGGAPWSQAKKKAFANDPDNLVITTKTTNRKKGANAIGAWNPMFKEYACKYHKRWIDLKTKYGLSISKNERLAVLPGACK